MTVVTERGGLAQNPEPSGGAEVIEVRGLRMRYGSVDVLDGADFDRILILDRGRIVADGSAEARSRDNTALGGAFVVAFEREDGTLLRAKAAPFGVIGYITGQVVRVPLTTVLSLLWVLVPGLFLFSSSRGWPARGSADG